MNRPRTVGHLASARWLTVLLVAAAIVSIASDACAQENSPQPCNIPKPDFNNSAPNIFSGQQEQDLGDALAELVEAQLRVAPPGENDQLTRIGDRLVAMLPLPRSTTVSASTKMVRSMASLSRAAMFISAES